MLLQIGLWASVLGYLVSWGAWLMRSLQSNHRAQDLSHKGLLLAWMLHTLTLIVGFLSWQHEWPAMFISDVLSLIAWLSIAGLLWFRRKVEGHIRGETLPIFAVLLLILSSSIAQGQIPALALSNQEPWIYQTVLLTHIVSTIGGYTLFALACLSSSLFLYQDYQLKTKLVTVLQQRLPALGTLEQTSYIAIKWGFLLLSVGVALGVLLSQSILVGDTSARLLLSVGVWFIYAMFLVDHHIQTIRSRWTPVWPIVGFMLILAAVIVEAYHLSMPDPHSALHS
jgi:ABC-type uncharacterized transport system permease subunit